MKKVIITLLMIFGTFFAPEGTSALDPPHDGLQCNDCHTLHNAPGVALSADAANVNLCMSCHNPVGQASNYPFNDAMQAVPGISGNSHAWKPMPAVSSPDNPYGLRATADLSSTAMKRRLQSFGDVVTCSVCHDQHSQLKSPWDPASSTTPGDGGRHFMRDDNYLNQLCEDCHYYRAISPHTDTRTWDGNYKSHPIGKIFSSGAGETPDVADTTQFNTTPLEPASASWAPQGGGPRYNQNGGSDTNLTNNIILDSSARVRCLSCHGIHYTDSDSSTEDSP